MAKRDRRLAKRRRAVTGDVVPSIRREPEVIDEGPSEEDIERFGDVTQRCPKCGTELYDDVMSCWSCGHDLAAVDGGKRLSQRWVVGIMILVMLGLTGFFTAMKVVFG